MGWRDSEVESCYVAQVGPEFTVIFLSNSPKDADTGLWEPPWPAEPLQVLGKR